MARKARALAASAAWILVTLTTSTEATGEVQSFDGSGNNVDHPEWGSVGTHMGFHFVQPAYEDGVSAPSGSTFPSARNVSQKVFSSPFRYAVHGANDFLPYFGQFICHDIAAVPNNINEPFDVPVEPCDAFFDSKCHGNATMKFSRTQGDIGPQGYREPLNKASTWVDASTVYGSTKEWNDKLRLFEGGLLRTTKTSSGELLPLNEFGLLMDPNANNSSSLFAAGDFRANINLPMVCLHTLFHLEHNWRARKLAEEHPDWSDQQLFDAARKYVIALVQKELYYHYVPLLIGKRLPEYKGYDPALDPAIDTTFMTSAFRYGHSSSSTTVYLVDEDRHPVREGHLPVGKTIFNPTEIKENGLDRVLRGLLLQPEADADVSMAYDLRNHAILRDLAAYDIQRGRDRGLASFNDVREQLNMTRFTSWSDLTPEVEVQELLASVYASVDELDAYVGGLAERPVLSGIVPPTFNRLIELQFDRLRAADRFHYENPGILDAETLAVVENRSLSDMVLDHTGIETIAEDMFLLQDILSRSECEDTEVQPASTFSPLTGYTFAWNLNMESRTINIQISVPTTEYGWVAIGFNTTMMIGADVVMGYIDTEAGSSLVVQDMKITEEDQVPVSDSSLGAASSIESGFTGGYEGGVLWVNFTRKFDTGDSAGDAALPIPESIEDLAELKVNFIFAYGTKLNGYHGRSRRAAVAVDLIGGRATDSGGSGYNATVLYGVHGIVMVLMWMVFIPLSTFVAHFFRTWKYAMELHQTLAQAGSIGIISFAASALAANDRIFDSPHALLGLLVVVWLVFQIWLGWYLRLGLQNSSDLDRIMLFKKTHRRSGWALLLLAIANCYLGVNKLFDEDNLAPRAIYFSYVGLMAGTFAVLDHQRRRRKNKARLQRRKTRAAKLGASGTGSRVAAAGSRRVSSILDSTELDADKEIMLPGWTWKEFNEKVSSGQMLLVIQGQVMDVRNYAIKHPAGAKIIESFVGTDATAAFLGRDTDAKAKHAHSIDARDLLRTMVKAKILDYTVSMTKLNTADINSKTEKVLEHITHRFVSLPVVSTRELNNAADKVFEIRVATDPTTVEKWIKRTSGGVLGDAGRRELQTIASLKFGQHVKLLHVIDGVPVTRLYTPTDTVFDGFINFVIKTYEKGEMTPALRKLYLGQSLRIHGPFGPDLYCKHGTLPEGCWDNVIFFAGGSGLTPALATIEHHLRHAGGKTKIWLFFSNTEEADFYYMDELRDLEARAAGALKITYCVTKPKGVPIPTAKDIKYETGYLDAAMFQRLGCPKPPALPPGGVHRTSSVMSDESSTSKPSAGSAPTSAHDTDEAAGAEPCDPTAAEPREPTMALIASGPLSFCRACDAVTSKLGYPRVRKLC